MPDPIDFWELLGWGSAPEGPSRPPPPGFGGDEAFPGLGPRPSFPPSPGYDWAPIPNPYGLGYTWEQQPLSQWAVYGPGGGGGGYAGPTPEELAIDWAQVNAITRGQDLDLQAAMRGYDIQELLGLKGIEVDWANIGIGRQQVGIDRERTAIMRQQAAEDARANLEREAENRRQRALDAATSAVNAYLQGSQLADARRLAAFQESRALLPSLVDPSQQYFAGQEPGGTLATMAQRYGLPFTGTEIQHRQMRPGELARPPTPLQVGSEIVGGVENIRQQGQVGL